VRPAILFDEFRWARFTLIVFNQTRGCVSSPWSAAPFSLQASTAPSTPSCA
jgi:hypothetical protein